MSDPAIRAELLTSLGISLTGLGEYQRAEKVLDQATQLAVAHLGQITGHLGSTARAR